MNNLAIVGAGGFGRETAWLIHQINERDHRWSLIGFYDDHVNGSVDGLPILGSILQLNKVEEPLDVVVSIADPRIRKGIVGQLTNPLLTFPSVIHPTVQLGAPSNIIGKGCILTGGCIFTTHISIGDFVIINLLTSIGHDVSIGSYSSIMPNCSISGFDIIGEECFIGSGARILQNLKVGHGATVGAGAVVTRDVEERTTVVGVPAIQQNAS